MPPQRQVWESMWPRHPNQTRHRAYQNRPLSTHCQFFRRIVEFDVGLVFCIERGIHDGSLAPHQGTPAEHAVIEPKFEFRVAGIFGFKQPPEAHAKQYDPSNNPTPYWYPSDHTGYSKTTGDCTCTSSRQRAPAQEHRHPRQCVVGTGSRIPYLILPPRLKPICHSANQSSCIAK